MGIFHTIPVLSDKWINNDTSCQRLRLTKLIHGGRRGGGGLKSYLWLPVIPSPVIRAAYKRCKSHRPLITANQCCGLMVFPDWLTDSISICLPASLWNHWIHKCFTCDGSSSLSSGIIHQHLARDCWHHLSKQTWLIEPFGTPSGEAPCGDTCWGVTQLGSTIWCGLCQRPC